MVSIDAFERQSGVRITDDIVRQEPATASPAEATAALA
jgi:hypothetical protein